MVEIKDFFSDEPKTIKEDAMGCYGNGVILLNLPSILNYSQWMWNRYFDYLEEEDVFIETLIDTIQHEYIHHILEQIEDNKTSKLFDKAHIDNELTTMSSWIGQYWEAMSGEPVEEYEYIEVDGKLC